MLIELLCYHENTAISDQATNSVTQEPAAQTIHEGQTVTLECSYETTGNAYLFWYRQKPGQSLEYLARADSLGTDYVVEKYQSSVSIKSQTNKKACSLFLAGVFVEDAAVYLCALTVKGSRNALPFGGLIRQVYSGESHRLQC
uniref:Ig-like domain-containing protein n=1 Tax=Leptobrachium leishanense TaxID=445787 RepID=A0A8C5PAA3_9ANUR